MAAFHNPKRKEKPRNQRHVFALHQSETDTRTDTSISSETLTRTTQQTPTKTQSDRALPRFKITAPVERRNGIGATTPLGIYRPP